MHLATTMVQDTPAPHHDAGVFYWSSGTDNTHKFALRLAALGHTITRIPNQDPLPLANAPFVLITPTYSDGEGRGAVPKPVIRFLNLSQNRAWLRGVLGGGNRNFGTTYVLGAKEVARKCQVPMLYDFELSGSDGEALQAHHIITTRLQALDLSSYANGAP